MKSSRTPATCNSPTARLVTQDLQTPDLPLLEEMGINFTVPKVNPSLSSLSFTAVVYILASLYT